MADVDSAEFWDDAYRSKRDGWDMGTPTPVFVHILERFGADFRSIGGPDYRNSVPPPSAALPCSGRGYDALIFSQHGFDVTAIDFSSEAMDYLLPHGETNPRLRLLQADLFTLGETHAGQFDLVVEYTCVCAIDPMRRAELVDTTHRMLAPGGHALMLLFPVDGRPGGPPFAIDVDEWKALMSSHFDLTFEVTPENSVKPRRGRERLQMWRRKPGGSTP
jgi:methyl halide transferase